MSEKLTQIRNWYQSLNLKNPYISNIEDIKRSNISVTYILREMIYNSEYGKNHYFDMMHDQMIEGLYDLVHNEELSQGLTIEYGTKKEIAKKHKHINFRGYFNRDFIFIITWP